MRAGLGFTVPGVPLRVAVLSGGQPLPLYQRPGDGQLFVAGAPGQEFTIRVDNDTPGRLLVVAAIDHRAVMEDKPADPEGLGMIVAARSHYVFDGWRQDSSTTRPFVFTFPEQSVAQQAAGPDTVTGVIGLAAYRERLPMTATKASGHSATHGERIPRALGTGIGAREQYSPVISTTFDRGERSIARLLYASEESLRAAGLMGPPEPPAFPERKAFQGYSPV